ncbi:MAG: DMT family transporter [Chloroflexi bacterium]|nr:DMT family transporter [Chloroflexota bacterium]
MIGAFLGLATAAAYGASSIVARGGVLRASPTYVANVSIFTGPPFFLLATIVTGDLFRLGQSPWQVYIFFALSGATEFALGRTWAYRSVQLIGATRSNIVTSLNFVVVIILAVVILGEAVKPLTFVGILLALSGPFLLIMKESTTSRDNKLFGSAGEKVDRATLYKGILYAAGVTVFRGSSPILVKFSLDNGGSPVFGTLVAYLAACVIICPSSFLVAENRAAILKTRGVALRLAVLSGLTASVAQLLRNFALTYGSVIVVSLVMRTSPLWTLLFAFAFIREHESLGRWVLLGNSFLVIGSLLALVS